MRLIIGTALLALLLCLPLSAVAADGYVSADVNLRTGPGTEYPAVTVVPRWTGLQVQGCVEGYSWCDVLVGAERGWIYAQYLQFVQGGEAVYINDYGPRLGIPIVTFSLGSYWDTYYPARPWYRYRGYWINHRPIYRPLPPPPSIRPPPRPPIGVRPPITRPPITRPPPRPRPPIGTGPGGRPPITTPLPRPPAGNGPGNRPPPNPGNGGNRPGPGAPDNGRPTPRPQPQPQTRPMPQNRTQQDGSQNNG